MAYLNIAQAAKHVGKTEKTLRRWVHSGKVPYRVEKHGQLYFDVDDLDKLRDRNIPAMDNESILARVEAIENALRAQSERLEKIEHQIHAPPIPAVPATSTLRPAPTTYASKSTGRSTVPAGMIDLHEFSYNMHNVAPTTAKLAIKSGRLPAHHGEWKARGARVTMALDADGQRRFIELFETNPGFKKCCDQCPTIHG